MTSAWLEDLLPWPCGNTSTSVTGPPNPEEEKLFSRLWSPAQRTSLASTAANPSFSLGMEFTYRSFKMQLVSTFVLFAALMWFSAEATEVKACQGRVPAFAWIESEKLFRNKNTQDLSAKTRPPHHPTYEPDQINSKFVLRAQRCGNTITMAQLKTGNK
uniref:Uncharacterized protein n=1 Tax=Timema poppense TaxID=170557 RepID=A0A7R9HA57_TIMPO|nr:unnamed protein product [Timema poppensis]